jgi:hypothetical protein
MLISVHGAYLYFAIWTHYPPGSASSKPLSRNLRPISVERNN